MGEDHRDKIRTSNVLACLIEHAEGRREMVPSAVTAGIALLRKIMPDMSESAVTVSHDFTNLHEAIANGSIAAQLAALGISVAGEPEQPEAVRH